MKIRMMLAMCAACCAAGLSLRAGTLYWCIDAAAGDAFQAAYAAAKEKAGGGTLYVGLYQDDSFLEKVGLTVAADGSISSGLYSIASGVTDASSSFRWEIMAEATSYFTSGKVSYDDLVTAASLASSPMTVHRPYNAAGLSWSATPVPEPTGGLLMLVGGALLALRRKRRADV